MKIYQADAFKNDEMNVEAEKFRKITMKVLTMQLNSITIMDGIPEHSRAARATGFLKVDQVTEDKVEKARRLNEVAVRRGQTLAEMALAWVLKDERMTSVIVGSFASSCRLNEYCC